MSTAHYTHNSHLEATLAACRAKQAKDTLEFLGTLLKAFFFGAGATLAYFLLVSFFALLA